MSLAPTKTKEVGNLWSPSYLTNSYVSHLFHSYERRASIQLCNMQYVVDFKSQELDHYRPFSQLGLPYILN